MQSETANTKISDKLLEDRKKLVKRLKEAELPVRRFLKLRYKTKTAYENSWFNSLYTIEELESEPSIGISGGMGLVLIDIDNPDFEPVFRKLFPETFETKSGGKGLPHFYYKVTGDLPNNCVMHYPKGTKHTAGEIRVHHYYTVSCGSQIDFIYKEKRIAGTYTITKDSPIAEISFQEFMDKILPYLGSQGDNQKLTIENLENGVCEGERHPKGIRVANYLIGVKKLDPKEALETIRQWNQKNKPPMAEADVKRMINEAITFQSNPTVRKKYEEKVRNKQKKFRSTEKGFKPSMGYALEVLNQKKYICPTDTKEVLLYEKPIYVDAEPFIHLILEREFGKYLTKNFVNEAYAHIQRSNPVIRKEINKFVNSIPLKNGMFNLSGQFLEEHENKNYLTFCYNAEYDRDANCPNWKKFLKQILPEKKSRLFLQEWFGYLLLPDMPLHKLFWFYGTGRNGKGVVIRTAEFILGKENCSSLNLSEFSEGRRFSLCQLYGKLLNVSSEPKLTKYGLQTNVLKMASGEDTIHAELKGKNSRLNFKNVAKITVLGNRFPKVNDNSEGWWERVEPLRFPNSFIGKKNIPHIEDNWIPQEINGILNWALEGLYCLRKNKVFTTSKDAKETKAEFMRVSDPFKAWILERCVKIPNAYIINDEALTAFHEYCDEIGADREEKRIFYKKMRTESRVKEKQKIISKKNKRVFVGITLNNKENGIKYKKLADLASLAGSATPQNKNDFNNKVWKHANSDKTAKKPVDIDEVFPDYKGKFSICFVCHKPISNLNNLDNIDGKLCHKKCKDSLENGRK